MDKTKNKRELKWYHILIVAILSILIYITMFLSISCCFINKRTKACTNNINTYANEQVTDLTGTTWVFNNEVIADANFQTFYINFNCNNNVYSFITFDEDSESPDGSGFRMYYNSTKVYQTYSDGWQNEIYKTISINDGQDITNSNLISWLESNATLQTPEIPEQFYNITYNLQNVLIIGNKPTEISNLEEIEIEIQNFNNYELPQNIMVENASYNWNYETGILTIYEATGNVNITVRAEYISGNYTFIELIDSVILIPLNAFFNLFNFEIFGVNIYSLLTATLTLFVIIKILLKVFK